MFRDPEAKRIYDKAWNAANPEKQAGYARASRLRRYGITPEDYDRMLIAQGGGCAICGVAPNGRRHHVDHRHSDGLVRGLLCGNCNRGLGVFRDSPGLLTKAIEYLSAD